MATPGRKPLPDTPAVSVGVNHEALAEASQAADQLLALQAGYGQGRDLVNQMLGQAQAFQAAGDLLRTFGVSKLAIVKENKLYQQLSGMTAPNGSELKGTWVEFCGLLGISDDKANEDIANLRSFGEQALEQMQRIGIGYRELRQYRKLPEDQKLALIEVAKAGDKEGFVELAEEIIAKHAKEKEATTRAAEEAAEKLAAKDRVIVQKNELVDSLQEKVARKFSPRAGSWAETAQEQAILDEINGATLEARHAMRRLFLVADAALDGTANESVELAARQAVEYLSQQLVDIATEFGIAVDFEQRLRPAWLDESALDAMEARQSGGADAGTAGDDDTAAAAAAAANVHHLSAPAR